MRASTKRFRRKRSVASLKCPPPLTPPHHALRAWAGGEIDSRSRDAFFDFASELSARQSQKPHRIPDLRQMISAVEGRSHHDQARHANKRTKRKKEAERRKAQSVSTTAPCDAARVLTGRARLPAFHCGSCPRDSRIPRTQLRARFRGANAKLGGGIPPAPAPLTASTSRAGHSAGRHDAQSRPGAGGTSPCPRAPQPAPPAGVLHGERGAAHLPVTGRVSRMVTVKVTQALIARRFLRRRFAHAGAGG